MTCLYMMVLQALLQKGVRIGVVASTDDHLGYPGAYGEGLVAVYADTLTREAILAALADRLLDGALSAVVFARDR